MRLVSRTRSDTTILRSRTKRRRSSSAGVGGTTMEQTRGSPRFQAIRTRSNVSAVDHVGLWATVSAWNGDGCGIDDMAFHVMALEKPINPKPVQSRLLD